MIRIRVSNNFDSAAALTAVQQAALKSARRKLRGIICVKHNRIPQPRIARAGLQVGNFCCDELRERH
jgi:hypothetical protein